MVLEPHRRGLALFVSRLLGESPLVSRRLRRQVLVVSVVALACLAGFGFPARNSSRPLLFDSSVDRFFARSPAHLVRAAFLFNDVGHPEAFLAVTAIITVALIFLDDYRAAVAAVVSVGAALVLVEEVLKPFFGRHLQGVTGLSFPSGNTVVPVALAGVVALAAGGSRPLGRLLGRNLGWLLAAVVLILACCMGLAQVVLESHYLTDVVAGIPLGLAVSGGTAILVDALAGRLHAATNLEPSAARVEHASGLDGDAGTLVRRVVDILEGARTLPLSSSVKLDDRAEVLELLDQALHRLPAAPKQGRRMLEEGAEHLARAQREADRIVEAARRRAERMVGQTETVRRAETTSRKLLEAARDEAARRRLEADDYCHQKLTSFEVVLQRTARAVAAGRRKLAATASPPDKAAPASDTFFDPDGG